MTSPQVGYHTFEQSYGGLCGQGERVEGASDVEQTLEVLSHVISAHWTDVVDRLRRRWRQRFLSEAFHQVTQHGVWQEVHSSTQ